MKAHIRGPGNPNKTLCSLEMEPWQTFPTADILRLIQESEIGLTVENLYRKYRQKYQSESRLTNQNS